MRGACHLGPGTAVTRATSIVLDNQNPELVCRDPVDNRVRKDVHGQTPPASAAEGPDVRLFGEQSADSFELCDEPRGQCPRPFALVESRSLKEVLFGIRMKRDPHPGKRDSSLATTISSGVTWT